MFSYPAVFSRPAYPQWAFMRSRCVLCREREGFPHAGYAPWGSDTSGSAFFCTECSLCAQVGDPHSCWLCQDRRAVRRYNRRIALATRTLTPSAVALLSTLIDDTGGTIADLSTKELRALIRAAAAVG